MSTVTEIRLLFIVGVVALAVVIVALAMLTQWLARRIERGRAWLAASGRRDTGVSSRGRRLEHELAARSARWRMPL